MAKKKEEQEALSEFQDLARTGRTDVADGPDFEEQGEDDQEEPDEDPSFAGDPFFQDRDYIPTGAKLKDGKCVYSFRQMSGYNRGEVHPNVKGALLVEDDLHDAVSKLAVHLAFINDDFKLAGVEIDNIDRFNGHDLTVNYAVDGFEVSGEADAETVTIIGSKRVSMGRIDVKSFKIPVDNHSSYKWFPNLREVVLRALQEVALYREGKGTPEHRDEEEEERKASKRQLGLFGYDVQVSIIGRDEFEGGKV